MLHLHVWGSAFGLASIDAECLAIITLLHCALPPDQWRLIPSNDPSISPSNTLPALHHDGVWTSGYGPIVSYLTSASILHVDAGLSPTQQADRSAYAALLAARAAPLLDLSLYVSAANWAAATRPAFSALLAFPLTWTVPPLLRAAAVSRVEHLGFADLDADLDPNGGLHLSGREALPESFRRHLPAQTRRTVHDEMTPEQAAAIRLYGLTEDCLSVLEDRLKGVEGEKESGYFLGSPEPSSLDCLAFGYLALMRDAAVPRSFLRDWLVPNAPRISKFVNTMKATLQERGDLPYADLQQNTTLRTITRTLDTVLHHLPNLGDAYADEKRRRAEEGVSGIDSRALMLAMSVLATGVTMGYGLYMYKAMQPFGAWTHVWRAQRGSRLSDFGEIGSMLGSAMGGYQAPMAQASSVAGGRIVESDSELD